MTRLTESEYMRKLITLTESASQGGRYWDNNGQYEDKAAELQELVPSSGETDTLRGELWRAATKIYYDYYNNGWGNDWRAPFAFIDKYGNMSPDVSEYLFDHASGIVVGRGEDMKLEKFIDEIIEFIYANVDAETPSPGDMWDMNIDNMDFPEENWDDDDDYDYDDEEDDQY
jgi:hypothetical protein